jgi:hypothetical protein
MRTRGDRRPVVVTLLVSRGPRFSARWSRRSSRHDSRGGIDVSKGSATAGMLAGRWQALRSHLSLALASATDCHCMFSGASDPAAGERLYMVHNVSRTRPCMPSR